MKDYNNCYGMPNSKVLDDIPVKLKKNGDIGFIKHFPNVPLKKNGVYKVSFIFKEPSTEVDYRGKQLELL